MSSVENRVITEVPQFDAVHVTRLLRVSIATGEGYRYAITIEPSAGASLQEDCLIRFLTHYYARVLYTLARKRAVRDLPALVDALLDGSHRWTTDVFAVVGLHGRLTDAIDDPIGRVSLEFRRTGYRDYALPGSIELAGRPLAYSMFAVLQALSHHLGAEAMDRALAALANMNASYRMTHHYADPKSQSEVPAIAYAAVAFM